MENLEIIKNELPLIVKRYIRKKKFTIIRRPYKAYNNALWTWDTVFNEIDNLKLIHPNNFFSSISIKYGIVISTLKNKYYDFKNNKIIIDNKEHRGHKRIFNNTVELNMFTFLKNNFIDKNEMLCNELIKLHSIEIFKTLNNNKIFKASTGWCTGFKNKFKLSTVRCSISRKATTLYNKLELNSFLKLCDEKHKLVGSNYFFNFDETKNNNINVSKTTIHIKGTDNAKIYVKNNEKEGVTAGLIINAAGEILKPIIIAKGKTKKCLNKYKLNNDNIIGTYSNNGWINNGIMKVVLDLINIKTNNNKACLLLDQFNAHTSESTKEYAATKNIELIFIPKGYTYKYQPLDVGIFSIIKQKSKSIWRKEKIKNTNLKITNADAIKHFLTAIGELTSEIIKKSFTNSCFMKQNNNIL